MNAVAEKVTYKFKVCANKDQLVQHGLYHDEWVESDSRVPNRVERGFFGFEAAANMYCTLKSMRLVAFKNWL